MIVIADSGASKTDWRIIDENGDISQAKTAGFNPYYQPIDALKNEIKEQLGPSLLSGAAEVFYYGTGCGTESNCRLVHQALTKLFTNATIEVSHDLLASARALCGPDTGIACILGTGVNSCFYNGKEIIENITSPGYILGDEGGGAHLGKCLLADYLRDDLPEKLGKRFEKRFGTNKDEVLHNVYQGARPGNYLGSFSKFIFQNIKEPYCYQLVYKGFHTFLVKNVCKYQDYKNHKVHFTGSVAFYYSGILRQAAADLEVTVGNIIESPIAGLTLYHKNMMEK